jgi:hypothetical protein
MKLLKFGVLLLKLGNNFYSSLVIYLPTRAQQNNRAVVYPEPFLLFSSSFQVEVSRC